MLQVNAQPIIQREEKRILVTEKVASEEEQSRDGASKPTQAGNLERHDVRDHRARTIEAPLQNHVQVWLRAHHIN